MVVQIEVDEDAAREYVSCMPSLRTSKEMYEASVARDATCDGVFYICVKTTGIFCRPSCRARKPRAENVEFAATAQEAILNGYRACKVCKPTEPAGGHPAWVTGLLDVAARANGTRLNDQSLRQMSVDPVAARRYFKVNFGMTFQAYQRAVRLGAALEGMRSGRSALRAGLERGWKSDSGFRGAVERVFAQAPRKVKDMKHAFAMVIETPLRPMLAVAGDEGLMLLEFLDRRALETELRDLRAKLGVAITPGSNAVLERTSAELDSYFKGTLREFSVARAAKGTEFQQRVWKRLCEIPFGETASYMQVAREVGCAGGARAVGLANGKNPIAIIVPCHRVINANGTLCGYGGGLWRKEWLLGHEGARVPGRVKASAAREAVLFEA